MQQAQLFWIKQWMLVIDAPIPFLACVASAIGVIWFLVNWGYARQVDGLKQQIAAADQNMKLFQDRMPVLETQMLDLQRSVQRHDSYAAIGETAASAVTTLAILKDLQSELLIPVRNQPRKNPSQFVRRTTL